MSINENNGESIGLERESFDRLIWIILSCGLYVILRCVGTAVFLYRRNFFVYEFVFLWYIEYGKNAHL